MFYFKFKIPTNADGTTVSYSPNWCGTRAKCAQNEKGLLYNDKERWGIGQAEGTFIPPDVEVLDEQTALTMVAEAKDEVGIYKGEMLIIRYNADFHKGKDCPYKPIICQEYPCSNCQVYADNIKAIGEEIAKAVFGG